MLYGKHINRRVVVGRSRSGEAFLVLNLSVFAVDAGSVPCVEAHLGYRCRSQNEGRFVGTCDR